MLVGIFLLINFSLMLLLGVPMVFSISTAAVAMILLYGGQTALTFPGIAAAVGNALVANNTGITIALFIISGDLMSPARSPIKSSTSWPTSWARNGALCLFWPSPPV